MDAVSTMRSVRHRWRRRRLRAMGTREVRDRLVEDAGLVLLVLDLRQISYDDAVDWLVRDAFGSADRLRAAVARARASGRPAAELALLEQAAARARALRTLPEWRSTEAARPGPPAAASAAWTAPTTQAALTLPGRNALGGG